MQVVVNYRWEGAFPNQFANNIPVRPAVSEHLSSGFGKARMEHFSTEELAVTGGRRGNYPVAAAFRLERVTGGGG